MGPCNVFWILLLAVSAYYLYTPMPSGTREPWKQQLPLASVRLISDISDIGAALGIDTAINITRTLTEYNTYLAYDTTGGAVKTEDKTFDGVKVRVYKPDGVTKNSPGLVYIHGGGWVLLNVEAYDVFCKEIAHKAKIVIISVEYRLAPEHKFPIPLEDSLTATKYFLRNAASYGVDPDRIGVAGDSAGGNLAMAVSLKLSKGNDKSLPILKLTSLLYPALQAFDFTLPSYQLYKDKRSASIATRDVLITYYQLYAFGNAFASQAFVSDVHIPKELKPEYRKRVSVDLLPEKTIKKDTSSQQQENKEPAKGLTKEEYSILLDPYFSPLLASDSDMKKLPKTYIMTADLDALRDDGWILAERMRRLNHPFHHEHYDGLEHGFCIFLFYDSAFEFIQNFSKFLTENL